MNLSVKKKFTATRQIVYGGLAVAAMISIGVIMRPMAFTGLSLSGKLDTYSATGTTSGYGFSTSLDGLSDSDLNQKLSAMQATGATWVRYDLSWAAVQPNGPDSYDWSREDAITSAAKSHGFKVLMIIDFTPAWAREHGCGSSTLCGPSDPSEYGKFAGAAAEHFKPFGVTNFEIWNEPNISYRFRPGADPKLYVSMLQSAYVYIKHANPSATVVAASTAPSGTYRGNYTPSDFLKAIYTDGAGGYFDAISAHPYTYPQTPDQSNPADAWGQLATMHQIMASYGDGLKQIWMTEYGAPTDGPNIADDHVSEAVQAEMVTQAVRDLRERSWAGPLFWYDFQDTGTSLSDSQYHFGLVRADGTHKPAYDAWVQAISGR